MENKPILEQCKQSALPNYCIVPVCFIQESSILLHHLHMKQLTAYCALLQKATKTMKFNISLQRPVKEEDFERLERDTVHQCVLSLQLEPAVGVSGCDTPSEGGAHCHHQAVEQECAVNIRTFIGRILPHCGHKEEGGSTRCTTNAYITSLYNIAQQCSVVWCSYLYVFPMCITTLQSKNFCWMSTYWRRMAKCTCTWGHRQM